MNVIFEDVIYLSFIIIQHQTTVLHTDKNIKLYLCLFVCFKHIKTFLNYFIVKR